MFDSRYGGVVRICNGIVSWVSNYNHRGKLRQWMIAKPVLAVTCNQFDMSYTEGMSFIHGRNKHSNKIVHLLTKYGLSTKC
jgi:hypothetical protein